MDTTKRVKKDAKQLVKEKAMYEKEVEDYLVKRVKELGLDERKLNPQMCKGIPDRVVFDPKGVLPSHFIECKRPVGGKKGKMQEYLARGLRTLFIDTKADVEYFLGMYYTKYYKKPKNVVE